YNICPRLSGSRQFRCYYRVVLNILGHYPDVRMPLDYYSSGIYLGLRLYWLACFSGRIVSNNNRTIQWWDRVPHWALPFLSTLCTSPLLSGGLCFTERVIFAVESFVLSNTLHKPIKPISTYVLCAISLVLALVGLAIGSNYLILGRAVVFYLLRRALRK
ncbi:unnamed protein product, partial [Clonostachys solani]